MNSYVDSGSFDSFEVVKSFGFEQFWTASVWGLLFVLLESGHD